jgi:tyrosyl-tRNA synthetase
MALCLMKRLQMAGNKPIALLGGGTGMIGDPSGRTDSRPMMTVETIQHNCDCFKKQMSRFIEFGDAPGQAMTVNNADWDVHECSVTFAEKHLAINNLTIQRDEQFLTLDGIA